MRAAGVPTGARSVGGELRPEIAEVGLRETSSEPSVATETGEAVVEDDHRRDHLEVEHVPEGTRLVADVPLRHAVRAGRPQRLELRLERAAERAPVGEERDGPCALAPEPCAVERIRSESFHRWLRRQAPALRREVERRLAQGISDAVRGAEATCDVSRPGPGSGSGMSSWRVPIEARSEIQFPTPLRGTIEHHVWPSRVLAENPWGDPVERDLPVYLPPSGRSRGLPLLVLLSGYTGAGFYHFQRGRFLDASIVSRLDRLIHSGSAPEAVMIGPDCLTSLGGSQYLNSSATGRYEDYVTEELVPWARQRYGTGPTAVLGTSSGGYGALSLGLRHPDIFSAVGSNAGDAYFEFCYPIDFPTAFREIRREGGPEAFLRRVFSRPVSGFGPSSPTARALSVMAYASAYSPIDGEPGRFDLPFDLETGALRPEIWTRWLEHDPVRMIERPPFSDAARHLRLLYLDGGLRDEYGLDVAARILAEAARRQRVVVQHEEYDGIHADRGPRYDVMIPRLLGALGPDGSAPENPRL
jgi:S-formylglutathione hydrolase FrmB